MLIALICLVIQNQQFLKNSHYSYYNELCLTLERAVTAIAVAESVNALFSVFVHL